jgi:peptidoglycan/xylan/chitin deacetylase (PgdA/CDA1 family)
MRLALQRLRKFRHVLLRRRRANAPVAQRLSVSKARWLGDADSPVVLMIDDLTNAWHHRSGKLAWEDGGDWGGGLDHPQGALAFLEKSLLQDFPEVRATFFVVVGGISAYTHHQPFAHSAALDATEASRRFFHALSNDPRFELAYHGYNHGTAGASTELFLQEWRGFRSGQAAVEQTRQGLEIFRRATGRVPRGGKYGGWEYNEFSEDALSELGFLWWCRDWMPRDVTGAIADDYYEPQFFGGRPVLGLPSTVHGHLWDRRQIDILLARRQIISIEEHIAPVRPDNLIQTPNIVDDAAELRRLYRYLRGKNVWHANCTGIAAYVIARERSLIYDVARDGFSIRYQGHVERPLLTLHVDCGAACSAERPHIELTAPNGQSVDRDACQFDERRYRHRVTIPLMNGHYRVRAVEKSQA